MKNLDIKVAVMAIIVGAIGIYFGTTSEHLAVQIGGFMGFVLAVIGGAIISNIEKEGGEK